MRDALERRTLPPRADGLSEDGHYASSLGQSVLRSGVAVKRHAGLCAVVPLLAWDLLRGDKGEMQRLVARRELDATSGDNAAAHTLLEGGFT